MKNILFILFLFTGLILQAQTYYIDPEGDDSEGDGSMENPWASLAYACSQVTTNGAFIYVNAGTYNESNQIIKAVGVNITGTGNTSHIISSFTHASVLQGAIQCASSAGSVVTDNSSISYLKLTGNNLTSNMGIFVGYRSGIDIHNCTIEDFLDRGIWFYVSAAYPSLYATGNKVRNCVINNSSRRDSGYSGAVRFDGQDNLEIAYNIIDMTFRDNGYNGNTFSTQRCKKVKLHHNTLYRNDHEITSGGVHRWNFFFECWDYKGDFEYYSNTHYGLAIVSFGGEFNDVVSGCTFGVRCYNNRFLNAANGSRNINGGEQTIYAITIEGDQHKQVYVYNNYIQRYAWGIALSTPSSGEGYWAHYWQWDGVYVFYNIIENVGYADHAYTYGILFIMERDIPPYYGVYNNILIANNVITGNNGGSYQGWRGIAAVVDGTFNNVRISNNIVYDFAEAAVRIQEQASGTAVFNIINITHNNFYSNGTDAVSWDANVEHSDRDITTGNITTDPLFMGLYQLNINSPAIDAGISVGLSSDYAGNIVPSGSAPDIGAYEFASTPAPVAGKGFLKDASNNFMKDSNGIILVIQ